MTIEVIPTVEAAAILGFNKGGKIPLKILAVMYAKGYKPAHQRTSKAGRISRFWDPKDIQRFKEAYPTLLAKTSAPVEMKSPVNRTQIREIVMENNAMLRAICKGYNIDPDFLNQKGEQDYAGLQEEQQGRDPCAEKGVPG